MTKSPRRSVRTITNRNSVHVIDDSSSEDESFVAPKLIKAQLTPKKHKLKATKDPATPPKQRKSEENSPPETPQTPSSLLNKLALSSPETKSKTFQRKQLFSNNFQNARKALHSTAPSKLPARENELKELRNFIDNCLENDTSSSLYISGPPGTGKTAALSLILQERASELKTIFVNCTAIKSSAAIYSRIVKELELKVCKSEKDNLATIEKYLTKKNHEMILLILDEIDQLDSKNQSVLYTIFEWPSLENSGIILIGIANALDLTDRILPRLQARCELKPKLMHFAPYSKQQIVEIFTQRLQESNASTIFAPAAIQLLAGKVAAVSGDVRRALDIGRRVIELAEHRTSVLQSTENLPKSNNESVDLKQVVKVLDNVYGTSQNLTDDIEDSFPLQQKIIVCTLILILKKSKTRDVTVGKLHDVYKRICQKRNLTAFDQTEFVGLCQLVETRGIIRVAGKKEPRMHKITLQWDEQEVHEALKDKQLVASILQDDKCLGRV